MGAWSNWVGGLGLAMHHYPICLQAPLLRYILQVSCMSHKSENIEKHTSLQLCVKHAHTYESTSSRKRGGACIQHEHLPSQPELLRSSGSKRRALPSYFAPQSIYHVLTFDESYSPLFYSTACFQAYEVLLQETVSKRGRGHSFSRHTYYSEKASGNKCAA